MSSETFEWLNRNVLIGMTEQRGKVWHYRASDQGDEPNHYSGPIPLEDVERRLFDWEAIVVPSYYGKPIRDEHGNVQYDPEGNPIVLPEIDPDRRYVIASDDGTRFANFTDSYRTHQFREWLLANVATLLDGDLVISSAGLIQNRGTAWVEVSVPENMSEAGVAFRPNLLATTSHTGKVSSTYKRSTTCVVCDNTYDAAMAEVGSTLKIRHTKNSGVRVVEARQALDLVLDSGEQMAAAIRGLTDQRVTSGQWELLLKVVVPSTGSKKGDTVAEKTRDALDEMYRSDDRVAPWNGTAFGAFQAWSTWNTHARPVKGKTNRVERNMKDAIDGAVGTRDMIVLDALAQLKAGTLEDPEKAKN